MSFQPLESLLGHDRLFLDDWWHSLGTHSKPNYHFLRKFSFLLYASPFISFDSADCPYTSCSSHLCRTVSRPRTESSPCPLFSKTSSYPVRKFSLCSSVSSGSTIFLYGRRNRSFFNIRRTLVREIFNFRLVTFFLPIQAMLHFFNPLAPGDVYIRPNAVVE